MICESCGNDTNPALRFCEFCGDVIEVDFDRAGAALGFDDDEAVVERASQRALGFLYLSLFLLINTIVLRLIVSSQTTIEYVPSYNVPAKLIEDVQPRDTLEVEWKKFQLPK